MHCSISVGQKPRYVVAKLVDKHETSLHGVFKSPSFDCMQLYIYENATKI